MHRKIYIYMLPLLLAWGCCECPLEEAEPVDFCQPREVTITEFNAGLNMDVDTTVDPPDTTYTPVAAYSIHSFEFPSQVSSSGSLPNDDMNFDAATGSQEVIVALQEFSNNLPYYVAVVDGLPANDKMQGDILVTGVSINTADHSQDRAMLRLAGYASFVESGFDSESSEDFCTLKSTVSSERVKELRSNKSQYGEDLTQAHSANYTDANIRVADINKKLLPANSVTALQSDIDAALEKASGKSVNIEVSVGDVFYYQALNGRTFIFAITDISQRASNPEKKRVTIIFNEI